MSDLIKESFIIKEKGKYIEVTSGMTEDNIENTPDWEFTKEMVKKGECNPICIEVGERMVKNSGHMSLTLEQAQELSIYLQVALLQFED